MARMGFDTPTYGADGKDYNATQYGGYGGRIVQGGPTTENGTDIPISTGAQDAVNRYQGLGAAAAQRGAYQVNFGAANQDRQNGLDARAQQVNALALQEQAARGQAPSRAEIMGNQVADQSLQGTLGGEAGAKPGGLAAAAMQSQQAQARGQLGGQSAAMGGRSNEMMQAMGAFGQGASGIRSGDYATMGLDQQQAEAQGQAENAQRQLNDRMQLGYEQRGFDVNQDEMNRNLTQQQIYAQEYATRSAAQQHQADTNLKVGGSLLAAGGAATGAASGAGSGGGGSDPYSDERAKENVMPLRAPKEHAEAIHVSTSDNPAPEHGPMTGTRANQNGVYRHAATDIVYRGTEAPAGETPEQRTVRVLARAQRAQAMQAAQAAQAMQSSDARTKTGTMPLRAPSRDPMTDALADGLAPHAWQYKPEYARLEGQHHGEQNVGIIAQNAERNPITSTIVDRGPDGMRRIDVKKSTSLALAAAGHNAQKIREQQTQIDALKGGRR